MAGGLNPPGKFGDRGRLEQGTQRQFHPQAVAQARDDLSSDEGVAADVEEIILDAVKEFDYPVCFGFPAGHQEKNLALPFGRRAKLNVGSKTSVISF